MGEGKRVVGVGLETGKKSGRESAKICMSCHGENYRYAYSEELIPNIKSSIPRSGHTPLRSQ